MGHMVSFLGYFGDRFVSFVGLSLVLLGFSVTIVSASEREFYPGLGGDFTLQGAQGEVQLSELPGSWKLLGFGYSHCPDICSMLLAKMQFIHRSVTKDRQSEMSEALGVVFVSIDSKRDAGEGLDKLQQYVSRFNPDFIGVSGSDSELKAVAKRYAVYYGEERIVEEKASGQESINIAHTDRIYLVNSEGKVKKIYSKTVETQEVVTEILQLLKKG